MQDPSGEAVERREATGRLGILLWEFSLSQTALLGRWTITASADVELNSDWPHYVTNCFQGRLLYFLSSSTQGVTDERTFTVENSGNSQLYWICFLCNCNCSGSTRTCSKDKSIKANLCQPETLFLSFTSSLLLFVSLAERPPFEMLFKTAPQILVGDALSGSVRVL